MSIEIRQLVVRCQVVLAQPPAPPAARALEARELKEQLLSQCREWLREELRRARER
jgi:hypothetical protein